MTMRRGIGAGILLILLAGCGSKGSGLYTVSGKVTMDGKPLPRAEVWFRPILKGNEQVRPASATTDTAGYYSLHSSDRNGALVGSYQVTVNTGREAGSDVPAVPESVPDIYNTETTLRAEISEKSRTFNFDLVSTEGKLPNQPATSTP